MPMQVPTTVDILRAIKFSEVGFDGTRYSDAVTTNKGLERALELITDCVVASRVDILNSVGSGSVYSNSYCGQFVIHEAINNNLWTVVKALIEANADLGVKDSAYKTAVERIMENLEKIKLDGITNDSLVKWCAEQLGSPATLADQMLKTILVLTLKLNQVELVRKVLKLVAKPDTISDQGNSALHLAVRYCPGVVSDLLDRGADFHKVDSEGLTAVQVAGIRGEWAQVGLIIDHAQGQPCGDEIGSALLSAVNANEYELAFKLLPNSRVDRYFVNTKNDVLHLSVQKENYELMLAILAKQPNTGRRSTAGSTAIEMLSSNKKWEQLQAFINACIMHRLPSGDTDQSVLAHVASDEVKTGEYGRWELFWSLLQCDDFSGWKKLKDAGDRSSITSRALANLNAMDDKPQQLYLAAGIGQWNTVGELVDAVDLDKEKASFVTDKAVEAKQWDLVKKLLAKDYSVSVENARQLAKSDDTELLSAVVEKSGFGDQDALNAAATNAVHIQNWELVAKAQANGANLADKDGSLLFAAVKAGQQDLANALLESGSPVGYVSKADDGTTVLHQAAKHGWVEFCENVISQGKVDPALRAKRNRENFLDLAFREGYVDFVQHFLDEKWVDASVRDGLVFEAVASNNLQIGFAAKVLSSYVEVRTSWVRGGSSTLHFAVTRSKDSDEWRALISLLIAKGFDVTQKNKAGLTPIQLAAKEGKQWLAQFMVQLCLEQGISFGEVDESVMPEQDIIAARQAGFKKVLQAEEGLESVAGLLIQLMHDQVNVTKDEEGGSLLVQFLEKLKAADVRDQAGFLTRPFTVNEAASGKGSNAPKRMIDLEVTQEHVQHLDVIGLMHYFADRDQSGLFELLKNAFVSHASQTASEDNAVKFIRYVSCSWMWWRARLIIKMMKPPRTGRKKLQYVITWPVFCILPGRIILRVMVLMLQILGCKNF